MPALEMAQDTGKLIQWLKAEGQQVTKGEPLMEIETDKVTVEIEATASGILANVTAAPGDDIPVGQMIALILAPGETVPTPATGPPQPAAQPVAVMNVSPLARRVAEKHNLDLGLVKPVTQRIEKADVLAYLENQKSNGDSARLTPASPKARRLASERSIDLATLTGSGPAGAVLAADVSATEPATATTAQPQTLSNVWRIMAERMTHSWASVPHFYLLREVNASHLLAWHEQAQARLPEKLTYTDLLVKLVAATLQKHPRVNASWNGDTIVTNTEINIGLAVAIDEGLIVPVIHQAGELGLSQIAARRQDIVSRAQTGKLRPTDIRNGTFTISNLGMYGIDTFNAIINPPQAAILAVGRIAERVVPLNGRPEIQPMLLLDLAFDHRVVDGARGARFLQTLANLIEDPLRLVD